MNLAGWICNDCAKRKELISKYPEGGNTVTMGQCPECERSETVALTPVCDFRKASDTMWRMRPFEWD